MVLRISSLDDNDHGLLHPGLPCLLLSSQFGNGGRRGGGRAEKQSKTGRSKLLFQPLASADASANGREVADKSLTQLPSGLPNNRPPSSTFKHSISLPRLPAGWGGAALGTGVGGGIYVRFARFLSGQPHHTQNQDAAQHHNHSIQPSQATARSNCTHVYKHASLFADTSCKHKPVNSHHTHARTYTHTHIYTHVRTFWNRVLMRGIPRSQLSSKSSRVRRRFWVLASSFLRAYSLHTRSLSMNSLSQGCKDGVSVCVCLHMCVGTGCQKRQKNIKPCF